MPHIFLKSTLSEFMGALKIVEKYAAHAQAWAVFRYPSGIPQFTLAHRDMFIEMAFLSAFLAWEEFLEETFTLYLLGKKPPKGKRLYSQVPVQTRNQARQLLLRGQSYVSWSSVNKVTDYNKAMFREHPKTYFYTLKTVNRPLDEISSVRNAIAHRSLYSLEKFKELVRDKLNGTYPPHLSPGGFLTTTIPGSSPPETFLDNYLDQLRYAATLVVPV